MERHIGVSGIQSNYAETPYGDIRNTEQAIACANMVSPGLDGLKFKDDSLLARKYSSGLSVFQ